MSITSSCQPHHHQVVGKCNSSGTHEFRFEKILGHETQCFVRVKWLPGSLFPRLRASICKSCRQKVHRTVGRARFALENVKRLSGSDHFWTMRSTKCARDCSASSISHKTRLKRNWGVRSWLGRWGRQNVHKPVARARFHIKIEKKLRFSEHIWKMRLANFVDSFNHSFHSFHSVHSVIHSVIQSFIPFHSIPFQSIHPSIHSFHSFIHFFIHSFLHFFIYSLHSLHVMSFHSSHFISFHFMSIHLFPAHQIIPISKLVPIAMPCFRNFHPCASGHYQVADHWWSNDIH